jgi:hypothetical protein
MNCSSSPRHLIQAYGTVWGCWANRSGGSTWRFGNCKAESVRVTCAPHAAAAMPAIPTTGGWLWWIGHIIQPTYPSPNLIPNVSTREYNEGRVIRGVCIAKHDIKHCDGVEWCGVFANTHVIASKLLHQTNNDIKQLWFELAVRVLGGRNIRVYTDEHMRWPRGWCAFASVREHVLCLTMSAIWIVSSVRKVMKRCDIISPSFKAKNAL